MASNAPLIEEGHHKHHKHSHEGATEDHELEMWAKFECQENPNIFSHLELATDGGFSEVKGLYATGSASRWLMGLMLVLFVVYNVEALIVLDTSLMSNATEAITALGGEPEKVLDAFYLSNRVVDSVAALVTGNPDIDVSPVGVLGALELLGMAWYFGRLIYYVIRVATDKTDGFKRWFSCQSIFWDVLPSLSCYSAMKLLNCIVPTVLSTRAFELITEVTERKAEKKSIAPAILNIILWIFQLIFGFVAGFDTFLMKLRIVAASAGTSAGIVPCLQFLVQVLGVVQLGFFVRKRLFVFIFGGEDGIMQDEETELMETWNALLARRIWREYAIEMQSKVKFFIVMLSFADEDFQSLVLNENEEQKKAALGE
jgi:hypothetical protein